MKPNNINDFVKECLGNPKQLDPVFYERAETLHNPPTDEEMMRVDADRERQLNELRKIGRNDVLLRTKEAMSTGNVKDKGDKTARVLIGDIEGNHQEFSHYIELKPEDYVVEYGNYVRLTDEGRKRFSGTHRWWDVNYSNYSIELCDNPKEDNQAAKDIGQTLQRLREAKGMTVKETAEKVGIRPSTLNSIEEGRYNTGIRQIADIAHALGAHVEIVSDEHPIRGYL